MLIQLDNGNFVFRYTDDWYTSKNKPSISLTMPKVRQEYISEYLFPFFYNMLPEGSNKQNVCVQLRIDANDHFSILMNTAAYDTIGAIQIKKMNS